MTAEPGGAPLEEFLADPAHCTLLDSEDSRLRDDATILMFEWRPDG